MWLEPIPDDLRASATAALEAGDVIGLLGKVRNGLPAPAGASDSRRV